MVISLGDSFYDWEDKFKHRKELTHHVKDDEINSLGIEKSKFNEFLKDWKEKNLKKKGIRNGRKNKK